MTFSPFRTSATPLYAELGILKFFDRVEVMNILYVHKFFNDKLPTSSLETLKFSKTDHSRGTRGNVIGLLKLQNVKTVSF